MSGRYPLTPESGEDTRSSMGDQVQTTMDVGSSYSCGLQPARENHDYSTTQRKQKPRPQYNRETIKIEDFLGKGPDSISAKEFRVLIPLMFQGYLYPNKETQKTKVKGLWEAGNRPPDWPGDVIFRDPNNNPKFKINESKRVFAYLKEKLLKTDRFFHNSFVVKSEPIQVSSPVFSGPLKFTYNQTSTIDTLTYSGLGGDVSSHDMCRQPSGSVPVPTVVMDNMEFASVARDQGVTLKTEPVSPGSFSNMNTIVDELIVIDGSIRSTIEPSKPLEIVPVFNYPEEDAITLTQLQNVRYEPEQSQMISVISGEESGLYSMTQECSTTVQAIVETAQPSDACTKFACGVQDRLVPVVKEFSNSYESNTEIMEKVTSVLQDAFVPMFQAAKTNKSMCTELSKFGGSLQELLQRFTFWKECNSENPDKILEELDKLKGAYQLQQVVAAPEASNEVQVMTAMADNSAAPSLIDVRNPYIPTIAGIQARAQQKASALEQEPEPIGYNKTTPDDKDADKLSKMTNLLSPMTRDLQEMSLGEDSVTGDPEQDHGITLRADDETSVKQEKTAPSIDMAALLNDPSCLIEAYNLPWEQLGIDRHYSPEDDSAPLPQEQQQAATYMAPSVTTGTFTVPQPQNPDNMQVVVPNMASQRFSTLQPLLAPKTKFTDTPTASWQPTAQPGQQLDLQTMMSMYGLNGLNGLDQVDKVPDPVDDDVPFDINSLIANTLEGFIPNGEPDTFYNDVMNNITIPEQNTMVDTIDSNLQSTPEPASVQAIPQTPAEASPVQAMPVTAGTSSSSSSVDNYLDRLSSMMKLSGGAPVIPTVVQDAAAHIADDEPVSKKSRANKGRSSTRRSSETSTGKHRGKVAQHARRQPYN